MKAAKTKIRKHIQHLRHSLMPKDVSLLSIQAAIRTALMPQFDGAYRVGLYYPHGHEINPLKIITHSGKKKLHLPVMQEDNLLLYAPYTTDAYLVKNKYGIMEPTTSERIPAQSLDLIFVPLIAFDEQCNRLGMGEGYYDRTLAFRLNKDIPHPILIGLAYEFQKIDEVPVERWDVPMDFVITEKGIYPCDIG